MGPLAIQQTPSQRRQTSTSSSSSSSPDSSSLVQNTMASPAVFPPLNLRSTSTESIRRSTFMPRAAFPQGDDSNGDAERRNVTALTIVELLARNGATGTKALDKIKQHPLPFLRPHSRSNSMENPSLPSLPKMVIPSLYKDQWLALPSSSSCYTTITPTTTGVSLNSLSPSGRPTPIHAATAAALQSTDPSLPKRGRATSTSGTINNSRKRQKDELTRLRVQVQELQRELEHVRSKMPRKSRAIPVVVNSGIKTDGGRHSGRSHYSPVAVTAAPLMGLEVADDDCISRHMPVWERMAQHQKEEKSKAEVENLRLKGLVQDQLKISKGLEKLLRKRWKSSMGSGSDADPSSFVLGMTQPCTSDIKETAVFASLSSGLDARLDEMEAVFEKGGLTRDKQEVQEMQMILDERRGPLMEVKDAKVLPFDVKACAAAIWESIQAESEATVVRGASDDTLCFKSYIPLRQRRACDTELRVRCVIRRFVDESVDRVVFVWESVAECPNRLPHVSSSTKGIEIRDCGWGLLQPLQSPTGESLSILQLCSYLMPQVCGVSAEQSGQHVHGLAEFVAPCYRNVWRKRLRNVENTLMNGAIRNSHSAFEVKFKQEITR